MGAVFGAFVGSALGVLTWGVLFGLGLRKVGQGAARAAGTARASLPIGRNPAESTAQMKVEIVEVEIDGVVTYVTFSSAVGRAVARWASQSEATEEAQLHH